MEIKPFIIVIIFYLLFEVRECVEYDHQYSQPKSYHQSEPREQPAFPIIEKDVTRASARFFLDGDTIVKFVMENTEGIPPELRGPLLFVLGFSQQSMKNLMSNMRSLGQMIISSLVMMAVKRVFFADLPTEADRNKASELTDSILKIINIFD